MTKYILQILDDDGSVKRIFPFKSLKCIERKIHVPYHQVRTIYQLSKKQPKFLHPHIQDLYKKFHVIDNNHVFTDVLDEDRL